jgi:hypothetical protein
MIGAMANARRSFKVLAVLFGLLAISNAAKPLEVSGDAGFVFFGERLRGSPNAMVAPLFALYLAIYAYGLWSARKFALPMGVAYAVYVILNLVLFQMRMPADAHPSLAFSIAYSVVAIGVSSGAALLLWRHRHELA